MSDTFKLPTLPHPEGVDNQYNGFPPHQVVAYAQAAILADRTTRAPAPAKSVGEDAEFNRLIDVWHDAAIQEDGTAMECWRRLCAHIDSLLAARTVADAPACKGVPDRRCNYLATCGSVCNKCGRVHAPHTAPVAADQPAHDVSVRDRALSRTQVDEIVYACRQSGKDTTYDIVDAAIRALRSQSAKQGDINA